MHLPVSIDEARALTSPLLLLILVLGLLYIAIVQQDVTAIAGVVTASVGGVAHWLGTRAALKKPGEDT